MWPEQPMGNVTVSGEESKGVQEARRVQRGPGGFGSK